MMEICHVSEEIQQTNLKQIINQMTKAKPNRIARRGLGTKSKKGSQEIIANKSDGITCRKRDIGVCNQ